jgi:hypothetical protein
MVNASPGDLDALIRERPPGLPPPLVLGGVDLLREVLRRSRCADELYEVHSLELHVESRVVTPADFAHVVGPLEWLFRAALETGNPVRWC